MSDEKISVNYEVQTNTQTFKGSLKIPRYSTFSELANRLNQEYKQSNGNVLYLNGKEIEFTDKISEFIDIRDSEIAVVYKRDSEIKNKVEKEKKFSKKSNKNKNWRKKSKGNKSNWKPRSISSESSYSESIGNRNSKTSKSESLSSLSSPKYKRTNNSVSLIPNTLYSINEYKDYLNKSCNVEKNLIDENSQEKEDFSLLKEKRERKKNCLEADNFSKEVKGYSENKRLNSVSLKEPDKNYKIISLISEDEEDSVQTSSNKKQSEIYSEIEEGEIKVSDKKELNQINENTKLNHYEREELNKNDIFQKSSNLYNTNNSNEFTCRLNQANLLNVPSPDRLLERKTNKNYIEEEKGKEKKKPKEKDKKKENSENLILFSSSDDDSVDTINYDLKMFKLSTEKILERTKEINNENTIVSNLKSLSSYNSNIFKHLNLYKIESLYESTKKRINIVLDLDMTMVYAEEAEKMCNYSNKDLETVYTLSPIVNEKKMKLLMKLRKFSIEMLKKLSYFCDFYIYTHGRTPYANEVVSILKETSIFLLKKGGIDFIKIISSPTYREMTETKTLDK